MTRPKQQQWITITFTVTYKDLSETACVANMETDRAQCMFNSLMVDGWKLLHSLLEWLLIRGHQYVCTRTNVSVASLGLVRGKFYLDFVVAHHHYGLILFTKAG